MACVHPLWCSFSSHSLVSKQRVVDVLSGSVMCDLVVDGDNDSDEDGSL